MSTPPLMIVSGSSRVRTAAPLNHALYAGSIGVPYFFDVAPTRVDRIYFHKLEVIRAYLPLAEWLFWIDDDAFFTDFRVDLRQFLADVGDKELVFCKSPVNPRGGWTWMSSGQFFIRNSPADPRPARCGRADRSRHGEGVVGPGAVRPVHRRRPGRVRVPAPGTGVRLGRALPAAAG